MRWHDRKCESPWGSAQLQQQQDDKKAHFAEGLVALQAEDSGTDATDAPDQSGTDDEGSDGLLKGLEELIWIPPDTQSTTRMDKWIRYRLRSMTSKQALETRGVRHRELLRRGCAGNSLPKTPGIPTVRGVSRTAQL